MVVDTFEGRIRKVSARSGGEWYCEVYGAGGHGVLDLAENMVETAKRMARVPQKLCRISVSKPGSKITRIEPL